MILLPDMKIFDRIFRRKESRARAASVLTFNGQAVFTPRRYDKLADQGYQKNVIAYRCIRMIATNAKTVQFGLFQKPTGPRGKVVEITNHPLLDLLRRPNPLMGGPAFIDSVFSYRQIAGNSYVEANRLKGDVGVRELWSIRPDFMSVVPGPKGLPASYVFTAAGGKKIHFMTDPINGQSLILHWRTFNPLNDWYGQSPIEAAAFSVDQHNEAGKWNLAMLQNSASPSGAFVVEQSLSDEQFERIKSQMLNGYQASKNAGKPMVLDGGADWKQFGLSPKDMDWIEGRNTSSRDIAKAFGVPSQLLGIPGDSTYANYREARQALWIETLIPEIDEFQGELNNWLVPMYENDRLYLDYDKDSLEALTPTRTAIWERVNTSEFLSINEKREAVGYEPHDAPEADEIFVSSGKIPLGFEDIPDDQNQDTSDIEDSDDENIEEDHDSGKLTSSEILFDCVPEEFDFVEIKSCLAEAFDLKLVNLRNASDRRRAWQSAERLRSAHMRRMARALSSAFKEEGREVVKAAENASGDQVISAIEDAIDKSGRGFKRAFEENTREVMRSFSERINRSLKGSALPVETKVAEDRYEVFIRNWIAEYSGKKIKIVKRNSKKLAVQRVQKILLEAVDDGLPVTVVSKQIETALASLYTQWTRHRSARIARTETHAAANAASKNAAQVTGLELKKEWIASSDEERTREAHQKAAKMRPIPMDAKFRLKNRDGSISELDHPGDPNGSAEQVINCRCTLGYTRED